MRKHSTNSKSGHRGRRNANHRVPESVTNYVRDLLTELSGGDEFSLSYLTAEYLSKYLDETVTTSEERRNNAIQKWFSVEGQNAVTNSTLANRDAGYNILPRVTYSAFLKFARGIIAKILGPLDDSVVLGSFSGGASTSRGRLVSSPAHKFTGQADTTAEASQYLDVMFREAPLLRHHGIFASLREVSGAVLFTVPKKATIDRCACKEPELNMYLQKGVGAHIRRRLRRSGINLNDQSVNRKLAAIGARDQTLATLDLSSASDTITIECIRSLLPDDWFLYLNDIRSQVVSVDGEDFRTEMFSSMGNGFTFELETLVFYALARSVCFFEGIPGVVSVYGDDIICPVGAYDMLTWVLEEFGFSTNPDKSFSTGPFRESCGGHYHGREDVTPFYLKRPATHITDVIRVANQLRRWALADDARQFMVPSTYIVWTKLASFVPRDLWGGYDLSSDTSLVSPHAPNQQLKRWSSKKVEPEGGRYMHWHNSNWKRTCPGISSPEAQNTDSKQCTRVRVRKGAPYCTTTFYEEVVMQSGSE